MNVITRCLWCWVMNLSVNVNAGINVADASALDSLSGVGPVRRKRLLTVFGSVNAIKRFVALGDEPMAGLARATIPALAGVLTASFFLSNISDRRIWVLLALGPLLASNARAERMSSQPAKSSKKPAIFMYLA